MIDGALCLFLFSSAFCAEPAPVSPPAPEARAAYPACLGDTVPLKVSREMPYAEAGAGKARGLFLLDYGANVSSIDLKALPGIKPAAGSCGSGARADACQFDDFYFISPLGQVSLITADHSGLSLDFRQAGVIGTDFLSEHAYALRYREGLLSRAGRGAFCSEAALASAGFRPLSAAGYFAYDTAQLLPLSALDPAYTGPLTVPNVPAVKVRAGGAAAVAQLDTGYSDYITRHSVNINQAFFDAIKAASPGALARRPEGDHKLSTCVPGVTESVEAYTLKGPLELMAADGSAAASFEPVNVFLKRTPPAAQRCGGIGTHGRPAAQLGASFMKDLGTVLFDPFSSRVWVPAAR